MGSGNGLLNSLYRRVGMVVSGMVARIHVLCVEMMAAVVVKSKSPARLHHAPFITCVLVYLTPSNEIEWRCQRTGG